MTIEEIQTEVGTNPQLLNDIITKFQEPITEQVIPVLTSKGYVVNSKSDYDNHISKLKEQHEEEVIKPKIRKIYDRLDAEIFEKTGVAKLSQDEKTYEYNKRAIDVVMQKSQDPLIKGQLDALTKQIEVVKAEKEQALTEIKSRYFEKNKMTDIDKGLDKINIALPSSLKTENEINEFIAKSKSLIRMDMRSVEASEDNEGNIIYIQNGKPIVSETDGKPLTAFELMVQRNAVLVAKEENRNNGGAGGRQQKTDDKTVTHKTHADLIEHLKSQGVDLNTKLGMDKLRAESIAHGFTRK